MAIPVDPLDDLRKQLKAELKKKSYELRDQMNPYKAELEFWTEMGVSNNQTQLLAEQSELFNTKWDMSRLGMSRDEVQTVSEKWKERGSDFLAWTLDKALRPLYSTAGVAEEVLDLVAPEGSPEGEAFDEIYNALQDGRHLVAKDPWTTQKMAPLAMASRKVFNLVATSEGRAKLASVIGRAGVAQETGMLQYAVVDRFFNELFSGLNRMEGEKKGFKEAFFEGRNLQSGPSVSEALAGMLMTEPEKLKVKNPWAHDPIVFKTSEGIKQLEGSGFFTDLFGSEIGFTDSGRGLLALKRDGFLDFRSEDLDFFLADGVADPSTWVTGGSSGIAKASGRALTKKGVRRIAEHEAAEKLARKGLIEAAETVEEKAVLEELFESISARQIAERKLIGEARSDPKLAKEFLRPRGEIRFMGTPIGSLGKVPGEQSLTAALIQDARIERKFAQFRAKLAEDLTPAEGTLLRENLERVGSVGRRLHQFIRAEEATNTEWLVARARAEGGAAAKVRALDNDLATASLSKVEAEPLIDMVSDPILAQAAPPVLTKAQQKVMDANRIIDGVYEKLYQEAVRPVAKQQVEDLIKMMRADHRYSMARRLANRLKEANAIDPEGKHILRTEIFLKNSDRQIKQYTAEIASQLPITRVKKIVKGVKKLRSQGLTVKATDSQLEPIVRELVALYDLRFAPGMSKSELRKAKNLFTNRVKQLERAEKSRAHLVMAKGDRGAIITPMNRADFIDMTNQIRKKKPWLPKLRVVDDPIEHVRRRGQVAYAKEGMAYLIDKARRLAKDDEFVRNVIEENLVSVGVLSNHKNVSMRRVDDAIDTYMAAIRPHRVFDPELMVQGPPIKPAGKPMTQALARLKTKEEKQLFLRKWMFGEGEFHRRWAPGTASQRFWEVMNYANDIPGWAEGGVRISKEGGQAEQIMRNWVDEALTVRAALAKEGLDLHDMLPRSNLRGFYGPDGTKIVPYRGIAKDRGRWRLTSESKGEVLYLPESLTRALQRMGDGVVGNPEVGRFLKFWDGFTNFLKLNLTSVGGFPSFQTRNMIGNTAFGFTAVGLRYANPHNMNLARKLAWQNANPDLALTRSGRRNATRMQIMQDISASLPEGVQETSIAGIRDLIQRRYSGSKSPALRKLADNPRAVQKEAEKIKSMVDEVVLVDDLSRQYTLGEILREVVRQRVDIDPRLLAEMTDAATKKMAGLRTKILRSNAFFEQWSRQHLFLTFLERGVGFEEAGLLANKWMLDYGRLAPFEQQVMKRLVPFYTFYRKTVPLMFESLYTRPGSVSLQAKILREPTEPVAVWGTEEGERIVIQRDGNLHVVGRVDLPLKSIRFISVLDKFIPIPGTDEQGEKGAWKDMALMLHPAFQNLFREASDFDLFMGRKADQKKIDHLGALFKETFGPDHPIFDKLIRQSEGPDGRIHYYFDRGLMTTIIDSTGLSRIFQNFDRLLEAKRDLGDGEVTAVIQWLSGLRPETVEMTESERMKVRAMTKALKEEAVRRGLYRKGEYYFEIDKVE